MKPNTHEERARAVRLFRAAYGEGQNVVTPHVLDFVLVSPAVAVELSEGNRFVGPGKIYGVSVAVQRPDGRIVKAGTSIDEPLRSAMFGSLTDAQVRIAQLREIANQPDKVN